MRTKIRTFSIYFIAVVISSALTFLSRPEFVMWPLPIILTTTFVFSLIVSFLPKKKYESLANSLLILAVTLPLIVIIYGGKNIYYSIDMDQNKAIILGAYGCSWVIYGVFGLLMILTSLKIRRK